MPIAFACPRCRAALEARSADAGELFACPDCGASVRVPRPAARRREPTPERIVVVVEREPYRFPHLLHFFLSLISCGLWLPIWLLHWVAHEVFG